MGTWITDDNGTRWVELPERKSRKSPRALRFADLKVGDQLFWTRYHWPDSAGYYLVTDLWFDPVAGQDDETAGRMVAIVRLGHDGEPRGHKERHTLRGLASQGFQYADRDYIAFCKARKAGMEAGDVVGIGAGRRIRARPKLPGSRL